MPQTPAAAPSPESLSREQQRSGGDLIRMAQRKLMEATLDM